MTLPSFAQVHLGAEDDLKSPPWLTMVEVIVGVLVVALFFWSAVHCPDVCKAGPATDCSNEAAP